MSWFLITWAGCGLITYFMALFVSAKKERPGAGPLIALALPGCFLWIIISLLFSGASPLVN